MFSVHGTVKAGFEAVEAAFRENFERRGEIGAAVSAWKDGEEVVDLWGGFADRVAQRAWQEDSVTVILSSTTGLVALCLLMLADRGKLDYDRPVADYWPEFAAYGKQSITVRQLLNHRAGLPVVDRALSLAEWADPARVGPALVKQRPLWKPGTDQGFGIASTAAYAAELLRRITGRSVGSFFAAEVARPLEADVFLGLPPEREPFFATLYPSRIGSIDLRLLPEIITGRSVEGRIARALLRKRSLTSRAVSNPRLGRAGIGVFNEPEVHRLELPWVGGIASARGLARIYAALAMGGNLDGIKLCAPETIEPLKRRQSWSDRDRVVLKPLGFSQGFLKEERHVFAPNDEAFGHSGFGGALGLADPDRGLALGYVMNRLDSRIRSPRCLALCHALYACV